MVILIAEGPSYQKGSFLLQHTVLYTKDIGILGKKVITNLAINILMILTFYFRKFFVYANLYNSTKVHKNMELPPNVQKREFTLSELIIHPKLDQSEFEKRLLRKMTHQSYYV